MSKGKDFEDQIEGKAEVKAPPSSSSPQKESFENGIPHTAHLVKEYSPSKYTKAEQEKESGMAKGGFVYYTNEQGKQKLWLNKGTVNEGLIAPIFNNETSNDLFVNLVGFLIIILDEMREKELQPNQELKNKLEGLKKLKKDFSKGLKSKVEESELISLRQNLLDGVEAVKPYIDQLILKEKTAETLGGEVNRLISGRRESPKTRLLHDAKDDSLSIKSRIVLESKDLSVFYKEKLKESLADKLELENVKPIKGLYEAILIRMFLMDNPGDISRHNMLIVDRGTHYQIENIDFGNAFKHSHAKAIKSGLTPEILLNKMFIEEGFFREILVQKSNPLEIEETVKKIAELKDEDLQRLTESLAQVKNNDGQELLSPEQRKEYLALLKSNRQVFVDLYNKIKEEKAPQAPQETKNAANMPENTPAANVKNPNPAFETLVGDNKDKSLE